MPIRLAPVWFVWLLVLVAVAPAQTGQELVFSVQGTATGVNPSNQRAAFGVRAATSAGSRVATVPLAAGATQNSFGPALVQAAAHAGITLQAVTAQGNIVGFRLTAVDGAPPTRGCIFGTDDTGLTAVIASVGGDDITSRFFGGAFASFVTDPPSDGRILLQVIGVSTLDGGVFGLKFNLLITGLESARAINQRIRTTLTQAGCAVIDIAMPTFVSNSTGTLPGLGVDRFVHAGETYRVSRVNLQFIDGARHLVPKALGLGWFPTGGFAEYGKGHGPRGVEPAISGEGGFQPGNDYDLVCSFDRGARPGVLLLAAERAGLPLGDGNWLLLDPATITGVAPFVSDRSGSARVTQRIPATAEVLGRVLFHQAFRLEPQGLASTSGLYHRVWQ